MNNSTIKDIRRLPGGTVITAAGEIDLRHQQDFQRALQTVCEERPSRVVVDLSAVGYMDSSGVGTLVKIAGMVRSFGGKLALLSPSRPVMSIFEITTLDRYFTIVSSEEEALAV